MAAPTLPVQYIAANQASSHLWLSCLLLTATRGCHVSCIIKLLMKVFWQPVQSVLCTLVISWARATAEPLLQIQLFVRPRLPSGSLTDWISDTHPQGYNDLQSLVRCRDCKCCGRDSMQSCKAVLGYAMQSNASRKLSLQSRIAAEKSAQCLST